MEILIKDRYQKAYILIEDDTGMEHMLAAGIYNNI